MPEQNNKTTNEQNQLDCIKTLLSYFDVSRLYDLLDVQPGTNMMNVKVKGSEVKGIFFLLKSAFENSPQLAFLGKSAEQRALVRQWVDYNLAYVSKNKFQSHNILRELESALIGYTFFAGHSISLCDVLFYHNLYPTYSNMSFEEKELYPNLSRWFALLQEDRKLRKHKPLIRFSRTLLYN